MIKYLVLFLILSLVSAKRAKYDSTDPDRVIKLGYGKYFTMNVAKYQQFREIGITELGCKFKYGYAVCKTLSLRQAPDSFIFNMSNIPQPDRMNVNGLRCFQGTRYFWCKEEAGVEAEMTVIAVVLVLSLLVGIGKFIQVLTEKQHSS